MDLNNILEAKNWRRVATMAVHSDIAGNYAEAWTLYEHCIVFLKAEKEKGKAFNLQHLSDKLKEYQDRVEVLKLHLSGFTDISALPPPPAAIDDVLAPTQTQPIRVATPEQLSMTNLKFSSGVKSDTRQSRTKKRSNLARSLVQFQQHQQKSNSSSIFNTSALGVQKRMPFSSHMPSSSHETFQCATEAIVADKAGDWHEALKLYNQAVDTILQTLRLEANIAQKNYLYNKAYEYSHRADLIKKFIHEQSSKLKSASELQSLPALVVGAAPDAFITITPDKLIPYRMLSNDMKMRVFRDINRIVNGQIRYKMCQAFNQWRRQSYAEIVVRMNELRIRQHQSNDKTCQDNCIMVMRSDDQNNATASIEPSTPQGRPPSERLPNTDERLRTILNNCVLSSNESSPSSRAARSPQAAKDKDKDKDPLSNDSGSDSDSGSESDSGSGSDSESNED